MLTRSLTALLACIIGSTVMTEQAYSQPTAKELYDRCRKALNTGGIYRAYIDGSGRLICYHSDIETGAVYNAQNGGKYNFGSRFNETKKKRNAKN